MGHQIQIQIWVPPHPLCYLCIPALPPPHPSAIHNSAHPTTTTNSTCFVLHIIQNALELGCRHPHTCIGTSRVVLLWYQQVAGRFVELLMVEMVGISCL